MVCILFSVKVCEKQLIIRERKQEYVVREREALNMLSGVPGFMNLYCTFQDVSKLYFVMTYAKNGSLLPHINKVGSFNLECSRFYAAELVLAIEEMHRRSIIHRDLKPENILLDEKMHIIIADFGSSKILQNDDDEQYDDCDDNEEKESDGDEKEDELAEQLRRRNKRRGSFVGTAQYVTPEILKGCSEKDIISPTFVIKKTCCFVPSFRQALPLHF